MAFTTETVVNGIEGEISKSSPDARTFLAIR
jgi:hypothetical protein